MRSFLIIFFIGLAVTRSGAQTNDDKRVRWRLMTEMETGIGLSDESASKSEWIIEPDLTWRISPKLKFFGQIRLYSEMFDNLEKGTADYSAFSKFSKPWSLNRYAQLELREMYLDVELENAFLRIGKQQIVWGQTEGIKVLDVVNPMSWREFIFDDFDDARIPLWAVKSDFALSGLKIQLSWIPDLTYHQFPNGTFRQEFIRKPLPDDLEVEWRRVRKPARVFKDSDLALRLSYMLGSWDLSVHYIHQYDDWPIAELTFSDESRLTLTPAYKRNDLIGLSWATTMGNFGFRGEAGYYPNRRFTSWSMEHAGESPAVNQLITGLAIDYFGIDQSILTLQWFSDEIFPGQGGNYFGRHERMDYLSLMFSTSFMNQKMKAKLFAVYGLNDQDGFIETRLSYNIMDNLLVKTTANWIYGEKQSIFGQFRHADRILFGFEYGLQSR